MQAKHFSRISKLIDRWRGKPSRPGSAASPSARERITTLLDKEKIPYRVVSHPKAYSALRLAESIHAPGREVAKGVIVRAEILEPGAASREEYGMVVLSAHRDLDLARFAHTIGAESVSLAEEREMQEIFPDCEVGAMPAFGNLYELPVYVDQSLAAEPVLFFPAGNHREVIEMRYEDFERLARPVVGRFALESLKRASGA